MENLTAIEHLDDMLQIFANKFKTIKVSLSDLTKVVAESGKDFLVKNQEMIVIKLIKDGFLEPNEYHPLASIPSISYTDLSITFEGLVFWEQGGYRQQLINENAQQVQFEETKTFQREQTQRLNKLTFWIALGTIMAAIYYVLEILNHFLHFYPSEPSYYLYFS